MPFGYEPGHFVPGGLGIYKGRRPRVKSCPRYQPNEIWPRFGAFLSAAKGDASILQERRTVAILNVVYNDVTRKSGPCAHFLVLADV